jgi:hypothetical protein
MNHKLLAAALTGLVLGTASFAQAQTTDAPEKEKPGDKHACKGKSGCKTDKDKHNCKSKGSCNGPNGCKGQ